jgi:hypothetical protein
MDVLARKASICCRIGLLVATSPPLSKHSSGIRGHGRPTARLRPRRFQVFGLYKSACMTMEDSKFWVEVSQVLLLLTVQISSSVVP